MRWEDIDFGSGWWTIPAERIKTDEDKGEAEDYVVPLPPAAVKILRTMPVFAGSEFAFTAKGKRPLNDFGAVKRRLDRRIIELNGGEPIEPWTFHDCRRTFRTGLSSVGVLPHIAELCLAHRQTGIARVYDLHTFEPEKRRAFAKWATRLLSIVEPSPAPGKVIPIRRRAAA